jgi:surface antigen
MFCLLMRKLLLFLLLVVAVFIAGVLAVAAWFFLRIKPQPQGRVGPEDGPRVGSVIDRFNGVSVHYNGDFSNSVGRNTTPDGYNLGLRYQCVEFVKRYYAERLNHRMPDSWGHAKDFYDPKVSDGQLNPGRDLLQFANGGSSLPQVEDLIIFGPSESNEYGHVAIVSAVEEGAIEIIQQNSGPRGSSRARYALVEGPNGRLMVDNPRVLGWLRKN